jgi:hypothetical protein
MSGHSPPTPNPHKTVTQNRRGQPARDFLPWRFSDAATHSTSPATPCRASEKPAQIQKLTDGATIVRLVFSGTAAFLPIYQMD